MAGSLSGGEQQMFAIGRALMGNPRVLLMDEPSEGLAPQLVAEVGRTIAQLKAEGLSILLVEQNIKLTLDLADDVVIINTGRVVFEGSATSQAGRRNGVSASGLDVLMADMWNKYEPSPARRRGRPGREVRPKSVTIDIHSHVGVPQAAQFANPHLDMSTIPLAHFAPPIPRRSTAKQENDIRGA